MELESFGSKNIHRHSGARALRKIDDVNFVAERASPESITTIGGYGFRACAKWRIPE
jgi:hypothetical protein